MPLNIAVIQIGTLPPYITVVRDCKSREELQSIFNKEIKPPDKPRRVLDFHSFIGEVADNIQRTLDEKGDHFTDDFELILNTIIRRYNI